MLWPLTSDPSQAALPSWPEDLALRARRLLLALRPCGPNKETTKYRKGHQKPSELISPKMVIDRVFV